MITIPEMEKLPTNCHECPICFTPWQWSDEDEYWCAWYNCTVDSYGGAKRRMLGCPLAESEEQIE